MRRFAKIQFYRENSILSMLRILSSMAQKQKLMKIIWILSCWYSLESSRWVLTYEYPCARVSVTLQYFHIIFLLTKIALSSLRIKVLFWLHGRKGWNLWISPNTNHSRLHRNRRRSPVWCHNGAARLYNASGRHSGIPGSAHRWEALCGDIYRGGC